MFGLKAKILDIETAFLNGSLEKEIFMECSPGMTDAKDYDILELNQCIYGLVHAARQYHKKAVEILCKIEFNGGDIDPCLF